MHVRHTTVLWSAIAIAIISCMLFDILSVNKPEIPKPIVCPPLDTAAALDRFRGLISYPSISNISREDHVNDQKVFRDMMAYLERSYPRVWKHLKVEQVGVNSLSLLITWPGSNSDLRPVLFVSHYDVVPVTPGSEHAWTYPPFSGELADGYVWGRGSLDIKFGVAALLEAASTLLESYDSGEAEEGKEKTEKEKDGADSPFRPERTIMFAFGHDEEVGGNHGAGAIGALLRSRGVNLELVVDEGGSVLLDGLSPFTRRPVAMVGLAEKGFATVEVTLRSPGGHSSMPPTDGSSIADQLWQLGTALKEHPTRTQLQSPVTDMLTHLAPYTLGWLRPLLKRAELRPVRWLVGQLFRRFGGREVAAMVTTTLALTRIRAGVADNVLPQEAVLLYNIRLLPGQEPIQAVEHLQRAVGFARVNAEVRLLDEGNSWPGSQVSSSNDRHFQLVRKAIQETWQFDGQPPAVVPFLLMGATDSKHYAALSHGGVMRFVPYAMNKTGGDLGLIHATNERVRNTSFSQGVCTYLRMMQLLAGSESALQSVSASASTSASGSGSQSLV
ncbi:hypothetical protein VaNZ11_000835 [Volvox africanus]|uniref:Peptidase M20 dimerisation domain-containing protein n=1 Tax=Volvox africanus TaxID=51714 RepID=A0ABQ5RN75_9CHLO|nr:hypothetical protein VaNZ11_000835 [Volvox africanus]